MKILLTADHHIKLGQKNVPKEWAKNRYNLFISKIRELEQEVDLHIMSGDIFDRVPTLEELEIYWQLVEGATINTIVTTGNHEAETKKRSFFNKLSFPTYKLNNKVQVVTEISSSADLGFPDTTFYVVPYEYIKKEATWKYLPEVPIFTHVRGEIPPHVKPEIPLEWLSKFPIVFAGDLHSHKNTQSNIVYPGSPMTTSFHREETSGTNGYIIIDTDDWSWVWHDFELPQLIRKTVSSKDEIVPTDFHHTIYELEGSMDSISGKVDNELLDRKIIKRNSEATLILNDKMDISQELSEYLQYVLEVDNLEEIMTVYHEHS